MTELTAFAYRELFVCWAGDRTDLEALLDNDHPSGVDCDYGWVCNGDGCLTRTDDRPCPTHAPLSVPGLRLVECTAEPPHILFAVDRDDYGHGCPACWAAKNRDDLYALLVATHRYRHGAWRRWRISSRVLSLLHRVGVVRGHYWAHGDGCRGCIDSITWRWSR